LILVFHSTRLGAHFQSCPPVLQREIFCGSQQSLLSQVTTKNCKYLTRTWTTNITYNNKF